MFIIVLNMNANLIIIIKKVIREQTEEKPKNLVKNNIKIKIVDLLILCIFMNQQIHNLVIIVKPSKNMKRIILSEKVNLQVKK
jgi:hypothetical protein